MRMNVTTKVKRYLFSYSDLKTYPINQMDHSQVLVHMPIILKVQLLMYLKQYFGIRKYFSIRDHASAI